MSTEHRFEVVVNDEEQYSIWGADLPMPPGWRAVGVNGTKTECLAHIKDVWTDMRPLSLRIRLQAAREAAAASSASALPEPRP
jgi:MbtH protein